MKEENRTNRRSRGGFFLLPVFIGILLLAGGYALGGRFYTVVRFNEPPTAPTPPQVVGFGDFSRGFASQEIENLSVYLEVGTLTIFPGEDFYVTATNLPLDADGYSFTCEERGGELRINLRLPEGWLNQFRALTDNWDIKGPEIVLTVPEYFIADRADISVVAGKCLVNQLRADTIYIDLSAGELNLSNLSAEDITVNIAAGSCTIYNLYGTNVQLLLRTGELRLWDSVAERLTASVDVGSLYMSGQINDYGSFTCTLGSIDVELEGNPGDYGINLTTSLGTVYLDGERYNGGVSKYIPGYGNAPQIDLSCDIGEIKCNFTR